MGLSQHPRCDRMPEAGWELGDGYEDPADAVATVEQTVQCDLRLYSNGWRSVRHRHFNRVFVEGLPEVLNGSGPVVSRPVRTVS